MVGVNAQSGPAQTPADSSSSSAGDGAHTHDRMHRMAEAAVEAEFETGRREESVREARAHILVRLARMIGGFGIILIGIVLLPLPGPGWLIIAVGFVLLSQDFVWAERTLARIRRRLPQDSDGRISRRTWLTVGATTVLTLSASLAWSLYATG